MTRILLVTIALLSVVSQAGAQDAHADDRQQLLQLMSKIEGAINARDMSPALPHLLPDTTVVFQDTTVAKGPAQIQAYFDRMLGGASSVLTGLTVKGEVDGPATFFGDDIATAHGHTTDVFEFRTGNTMSLRTSWSTTVLRQDDVWRIAALHFSNNLFDNPLLNGAKRTVWMAAGAGLVAGVVLMALVRRLIGR